MGSCGDALLVEPAKGGFSFENTARNVHLQQKSQMSLPKAIKTGTTIVGIQYKDGIVLGADTRATEGNIVADKNCEKIHYIAERIYCCGAGTAADTEMTTRQISSQLELHRLNVGREPRVATACTLLKHMLFRYQGHIGAALVLGGVDPDGVHLYTISPHGYVAQLPYVTMGSGSLAAMAVFEQGFRLNMERDEAVKLVRDAIAAGIFNDLGSGSNVDVCVITKDKTDYMRTYEEANVKGKRSGRYAFAKGTTAVLSRREIKVEYDVMNTRIIRDTTEEEERMDAD